MEYLKLYISAFVQMLNEMSPFLMLGLLMAGILHVFMKKERMVKYLGKANLKSAIYAALIGIPLPLCSCGVIPTGVAFYKEGASKGASVSFLISTPQTGIDSFAVTWSMMSLPFAIVRPIIAFLTGIFGGFLTNTFDNVKFDEHQEKNIKVDHCDGDSCDVKSHANKFTSVFHYAYIDFLSDIAKWLLIGLLIAAFITVIIPDNFFTMYMNNPFLSMLIVLVISAPLYTCATGSVSVAVALMAKGLSPGAALVLLMAGPATNATAIAVLSKVLGRKSLIIYIISTIIGAMFFGLIIDYLLPVNWFTVAVCHGQHHHTAMLPEWFSSIMSILLGSLILYAIIKPYIKTKPKTMNFTLNTSEVVTVKVDGMTCNHCKANVEKGISTVTGVEKVEVDLASKTATITGKAVSIDDVKNVVESRGYEWGGVC